MESLTSPGLQQLRKMLADARDQRQQIETDLSGARTEHTARKGELSRKKRSLFRFFFKRRIAELEEKVPSLAAEVERLEGWLEATHIEVQFETDDAAQRGYAALVRAYEALRTCAAIWDVTSDRSTNRVAERTSASRAVDRRPVAFDYSKSDLIRFAGKTMRFANVNGEDILLYPGMILMPRADGEFALLDVREVDVKTEATRFIEEEAVPKDAQIITHTWAKVNKDGSPDRRFKENHQIPVCLYGRITFKSPTGLTEEYQVSNADAARAFGQAYAEYQIALTTLVEPIGTSGEDAAG